MPLPFTAATGEAAACGVVGARPALEFLVGTIGFEMIGTFWSPEWRPAEDGRASGAAEGGYCGVWPPAGWVRHVLLDCPEGGAWSAEGGACIVTGLGEDGD